MFPNPSVAFYWPKKIIMNPIDKDKSDLYELIYEIVRLVPKGRVTSYGAIAEALGLRSGARLVGYAMNLSHSVFPEVPAHRVVNSAGLLTGKFHFGSPEKMQQLLEKEGVAVRNDKVLSFSELFWNPRTEL
jgi:methylated-DNA-protein-cysteine methyltransferase-like protein